MLFSTIICSAAILSLASAGVLQPSRQSRQLLPRESTICPVVTINNYITVTVTQIPEAVTIVVPDYSAISNSLASIHSVDSAVAVESSQDRPPQAPPDTRIPTWVYTISAPAFEATEGPHGDDTVYYVSATPSPGSIAIATTTDSVILHPDKITTDVPNGNRQPTGAVSASLQSSPTKSFLGWNSTQANATTTSSAANMNGTAAGRPSSTVTQTSYVSTTSVIAVTTITVVPYEPSAGYSAAPAIAKRQTCVLVSALIGGSWASWCNNWDGSATLSYSSYETTITPTSIPGVSTSTPQPPPTLSSTTVLSVTAAGSTTTQTTVAGPVPSNCGQSGAFNISFDDLPKQSVSDGQTAGLPPFFSPFEHFYWASGWSYLPPPSDPYPPHSGDQLAVYVPNSQDDASQNSDFGVIPAGGFGAGPRSSIDAYWFNMQSVWVGCDNNATDSSDMCEFVAEGYDYDNSTNTKRLRVIMHTFVPLCHSFTCQLQQLTFNPSFVQLIAVNFYANIGGVNQTFYMDDMQMSWWNNTCEASLLRASSRR